MDEMLQEALRGLLYAGVALVATLLVVGARLLWARIQIWFEEQMNKLPETQREYYELAARMVVAYVEQLVRSGRLGKDAEARLNEALAAGERILREVFGIKNADLSVLRVFIEMVIDEIHRMEDTSGNPENNAGVEPSIQMVMAPFSKAENTMLGEKRLPPVG